MFYPYFSLDHNLPRGGKHTADLRAGFGSLKFLSRVITTSKNNFNSKLILYSDYIEFKRGFMTNTLLYQNTAKIDVYITGK